MISVANPFLTRQFLSKTVLVVFGFRIVIGFVFAFAYVLTEARPFLSLSLVSPTFLSIPLAVVAAVAFFRSQGDSEERGIFGYLFSGLGVFFCQLVIEAGIFFLLFLFGMSVH